MVAVAHPPAESGGRKDRGFSLFELVVVLVLMTIAAAIVLPSFSTGMAGLRLSTTARNMVTKLKQVRSRAIAEQKVYRVVFQAEEKASYAITDDYGEKLEEISLPEGYRLLLDADLEPVVSFYSNGRSSGFKVAIQNQNKQTQVVLVDTVSGLPRARPPKDGELS